MGLVSGELSRRPPLCSNNNSVGIVGVACLPYSTAMLLLSLLRQCVRTMRFCMEIWLAVDETSRQRAKASYTAISPTREGCLQCVRLRRERGAARLP
jgi:hypothetical protein